MLELFKQCYHLHTSSSYALINQKPLLLYLFKTIYYGPSVHFHIAAFVPKYSFIWFLHLPLLCEKFLRKWKGLLFSRFNKEFVNLKIKSQTVFFPVWEKCFICLCDPEQRLFVCLNQATSLNETNIFLEKNLLSEVSFKVKFCFTIK